MNLQELKRKTPADLLAFAEQLQIENASNLRKQDMMFAILKQLAENDQAIYGDGVPRDPAGPSASCTARPTTCRGR
jgi:transcription termination factor Rho